MNRQATMVWRENEIEITGLPATRITSADDGKTVVAKPSERTPMREEFDPDQGRDDEGQWTSGGSGAGGAASPAGAARGWADLGVTASPDKPHRLAMPRSIFEKLQGGRSEYQPGEKVLVWRDENNIRIGVIEPTGRQQDGSYDVEGKDDRGVLTGWNKSASSLAPHPGLPVPVKGAPSDLADAYAKYAGHGAPKQIVVPSKYLLHRPERTHLADIPEEYRYQLPGLRARGDKPPVIVIPADQKRPREGDIISVSDGSGWVVGFRVGKPGQPFDERVSYGTEGDVPTGKLGEKRELYKWTDQRVRYIYGDVIKGKR